MKEIKAYMRTVKVEETVRSLEKAGICGMTVIDVMALGTQSDPKNLKFSMELIEKYTKVVKLELVCADEKVHQILEILKTTAYTGQSGDGIIYVSPVEMAIKIRTGAIGEEGLE